MKDLKLPIITKYIVFSEKELSASFNIPKHIKNVPEAYSYPHKETLRF